MVELCWMICLLPMRICGHAGQAGRFRLVSFTEDFWHCRQTGVASTRRAPGPGTCYPHGGCYDCHGYHGFRQSGTDRVYATDSMPSCDICLHASVGRRVQSTFNIINAADFDVTTSFRTGRSFLLSVTVSLCLPSGGEVLLNVLRCQLTY